MAALRGLDVRVEVGEVAAVVGPSGSGKSTLLRLVAGLDRPSAGRLVVFDRDLTMASASQRDDHRRDRVGVVEQHYRRALSPYLPVARAIEPAAGAARRGPAPSGKPASPTLLERIGLHGRGEALPPPAVRRRAAARRLRRRRWPPARRCCSPTSRPVSWTAPPPRPILGVLRDLVRADGTTCLIVTHDELVERVADRVIHVADGRAVAERVGPPGTTPGRVRDGQGWLAPALPEPTAPVGRAVRAGRGAKRWSSRRSPATTATVRPGRSGLPATSASFGRGTFHAITGPSGSGKTTLLRLITGLDRPTGAGS